MVRPMSPADAGSGGCRGGTRRTGRDGQGRRGRGPAPGRRVPRTEHPGREGFPGRPHGGQFTGAVPRQTADLFLRGLLPSEADRLVELGDEDSLRRALELEPGHAGALAALARLVLADDDTAGPALAAIAGGDPERGLQLLLEGVRGSSGESRDALRKVMVGVFADLGQDHPLALRYRRELASALY